MTTTPDDKCHICGETHPWPDGTVPKHPFSAGEGASTAFLGQRDRRGAETSQRGSQGRHISAPRPTFPLDPVLRQALIDKGVLTPQDLTDAEAKIHAITGMFNKLPDFPSVRGITE